MHTSRLQKSVRRIILEQSRRANVGHIGSCLSVVDILCTLYDRVLNVPSPSDSERDRLILSKGHAALALYAVLALKGWISREQLDTFCGEDSLLGVHPDVGLPGIDFSSGSLGQGLGIAAGAALAARLQGSPRRVFCLISDAECNEGSVWEAAMFAAHHKLDSLRAIIDLNGQQALGLTRDVSCAANMAERWRAFGWEVRDADGHSASSLTEALNAPSREPFPRMIIARTVFGKGVSYMQRGIPVTQIGLPIQPHNWHYLPMSQREYEIAIAEIEDESVA
jgi:transketolase